MLVELVTQSKTQTYRNIDRRSGRGSVERHEVVKRGFAIVGEENFHTARFVSFFLL